MSVFNPFCESRELIRDGGAGYTDKGKNVLTLALTNGAAQIEATSDVLEVYKTYTIRTDSGEYTAECKHTSRYGADVKIIGNGGLILQGLLTDNGLPYGVVYVNNTNPEMGEVGTFYGAADTNGGSNITVSIPDVIHTIDPKYLGGAVLPVVELSGEFTGQRDLTAEESTVFDALAETGSPIIVKFNYNGTNLSLVFNYMGGDITAFCGNFETSDFVFGKGEGRWVFVLQCPPL